MANSGFKNFIVNNGILNFAITIVSSDISWMSLFKALPPLNYPKV
jgi:hypothetical protein